jgi:DNA-directed RNA polymerase specialized sigma54-like protein
MHIALRQRQILTQKLVMTPQMQQAIKLLPMSRMELPPEDGIAS